MIEAYSTAWRKWPLWYVLVTTIIQCALGQAGRLIAAAAVLYYVGTEAMGLPISLTVYGLILAVVSVAIILRGRYKAVEVSAKILAAILVVSTLAVYLAEPAPLAEMGHFFLVEIPDGSWLIIAAFLGLLPTGIDVSLQASEWGKAKKKGMSRIREQLEGLGIAEPFDPFAPDRRKLAVDTSRLPENASEYCRSWFRIGTLDFRQGHVISFHPRGDLRPSRRRLALSERRRGARGHGRDRRDLHREPRAGDDDHLHARGVRRDVLDRVQTTSTGGRGSSAPAAGTSFRGRRG